MLKSWLDLITTIYLVEKEIMNCSLKASFTSTVACVVNCN